MNIYTHRQNVQTGTEHVKKDFAGGYRDHVEVCMLGYPLTPPSRDPGG